MPRNRIYRSVVETVGDTPLIELTRLGEARERPLGSGVSFYVLLHGIVQHNAAHAAQISLLRKAVV